MLYFAYGSNLNLNQLNARCPKAYPVSQAILNDYKLVYRRGVATIEESKGDKVYGAVYIITTDCLESLDIYEGYPRLYYRDELLVDVRGIGQVKVMTYMMHKHFKMSGPREGYYEVIEEGYDDWKLPVGNLESSLLKGVRK